MKKTAAVLIAACLVLSSCGKISFGVIGSADGQTKIIVSNENENLSKGLNNSGSISPENQPVLNVGSQSEKRPVKMFCLDGELYYDTGMPSEYTARCGVLDGNLVQTVPEGQVPKNSGEANFAASGYQHATDITKEVEVDGEWRIFKKYSTSTDDIENYKYCFYIKGRLNNASSDSEIIVLTDSENVTFNDVFSPLLSSVIPDDNENMPLISFDCIFSGDSFGITLWAENVSATGMTLCFEQFGDFLEGTAQFGSAYTIEKLIDDSWKAFSPKTDDIAWTDIAYIISRNDITFSDVDWSYTYGELSPGSYRLIKKVCDFVDTKESRNEKEYFAYFDIK